MSNIVVQEFNITISGKASFALQACGGEVLVPTFGFNKDGKVLSRKIAEKEGYAPLQQEWIDENIRNAAKNHDGIVPKNGPIYVAVLKRSDAPNEIGIVSDTSPMSLENSSIIVEKKEYKFGQEK